MRNLLALLGLVVVGFAAIGWYCEWYTFSVSKGSQGKPEIKTTVDTEKVTDDSAAFFKRMGQLVNEQSKQGEKKGEIQPVKPPEGTIPGKGDSQPGGWLPSPARPASKTGSPDR